MNCGFWCTAAILIVMNGIYMAIGLFLLILGVIIKVNPPGVNKFLSDFYKPYIESFQSSSQVKSNSDDFMKPLLDNMSSISIALIIEGIIIIGLGILIIVAIRCKSKFMIIIYLVLLSIVVLIQIIVIIMYASDPEKVKKIISDILNQLISKYESFSSTNGDSFFINVLQIVLNCCGVQNYMDFLSAPNFNRSFIQNFTYNGETKSYNVTLQYPISCCQFSGFNFVDKDNCLNGTSSNNKNNGCVTKFLESSKQYINNIFYVSGGFIGFQILVLIWAIVCVIYIKKSNIKTL